MELNWKNLAASLIALSVLIVVPLAVDLGSHVMNVMVTLFIYIILAQSWNLLGGYTGQINLGVVAFFGISTMVTHFLWKAGIPIPLPMIAGCASSVLLA